MRIHKLFVRLSTPALSTLVLLGLLSLFASRVQAQAGFLDMQFTIGDSSIAAPSAVAADTAGNVYVTDSVNNRVVELPLTPTGFGQPVTLLAGLAHPGGILVDWSGNLLLSDSGNNRILRLPATGAGFGSATTVATGLNAPGGLAIDSNGNLFVADTGNNRVVELPVQGSGFGAAIALGSGFSAPAAVAVDGLNNLYVADTGNNRITKLACAGAYTTAQTLFTIAAPAGIAVDGAYDLFIASANGQRIVEEPWNAAVSRFNSSVAVGNGWTAPAGILPDSKGNLFVADAGSGQVWEIPAAAHPFAATAVGAANSQLQSYNFTLAAGTTLGSYAVLTQGSTGLDFVDAGGSSCTAQSFATASACSVQVQFHPTATGTRQGAVVLYDGAGNTLATAYLSGTGTGSRTAFYPAQQLPFGSGLSNPSGVAVDAAGNIYIADTGNNRIVEIPCLNGAYGSQITLSTAQLNSPMGLAVDGAGNLFIASSGNDKIVELPRSGSGFLPQVKIPIAVYAPSALTFDGSGTLYIADTYNNHLVKMAWKGTAFSTPTFFGNTVKMPMGIAVDNLGNAFFTLPYLNNLAETEWVSQKYLPQWNVKSSAIAFPTSVVTDGNGNIYLLDSGNNRVVMYPATASGLGAQVTVATGFNTPIGMAIDGNGNLYVADTGNNRIVRINLAQPATLNFASTYVNTASTGGAQATFVQNTGNLPTSVTAVAYPKDFPEDPGASNSCIPAQALNPGSGCPLAANFAPQAAGTLSESLSVSLSDSVNELTASVPVSGTSLSLANQSINIFRVANLTYGAAPIKLSATATSGLGVSFQVVSGPATLAGSTLTLTGAGTVTVAASQTGNATFQAATATMTFNVLPATLTLKPNSATASYGAIPAAFSYTISGFVLGQTAAKTVTGAPQITVDAGTGAAVGTHSLIAALGTLQSANYQFAFTPGTLTVKQATLLITANAAKMAYGASLPKFAWTATGFVNGDTTTVLAGAPIFATPASSRSSAGAYTVTPTLGTLAAANYAFTFASGTLTVVPAALTLTANPQSMVYGTALPAFTYSVQGLEGSDTAATALTGAPAFTTAAGPTAKVGSYALTLAQGTLKSGNYTCTFVNSTVTVVPAPLTVTPATVTLTYGQSIPALTALQLTGLVNGDTQATALSGSAVLTTTAAAGTPPGNAVIAIQKGTLAAANYSLSLAPGTLVIKAATLTVTPTAAARSYGAANPTISYTLTGFVHGDTATTAVSGTPAFTTPAKATSPAGSYAVTAAAGTLASPCYTFTFAAGTLTVTKAALTITAKSAAITYGAATPSLTYTVTGFQNGETASVLSGAPALSTTAAAKAAAGSYAISVSTTGVSAANYTLTPVAGTLTVAKAAATVTASSLTTAAGSAIPSLTYVVSGLVAGDQAASAVTGKPNLSTTATSTSAAGKYSITIANGTLAASNYTLTLVNGTLTLTQPTASVANPTPITPRLPNTKTP